MGSGLKLIGGLFLTGFVASMLGVVLFGNIFAATVLVFLAQLMYIIIFIESEKNRRLRADKARENFEKEQAEKGLVRFVSIDGVERWGTPEQVEKWRLEEKRTMEEAVKLKETIVKEVVKVRCSYCNMLYDLKQDRCPHCGAPSMK